MPTRSDVPLHLYINIIRKIHARRMTRFWWRRRVLYHSVASSNQSCCNARLTWWNGQGPCCNDGGKQLEREVNVMSAYCESLYPSWSNGPCRFRASRLGTSVINSKWWDRWNLAKTTVLRYIREEEHRFCIIPTRISFYLWHQNSQSEINIFVQIQL